MLAAVFAASLATLALEALLARYFALTQWHHLSFMVISVALLGFAASGVYLQLRGAGAGHGDHRTTMVFGTSGLAVAVVATILLLNVLPIDFFRIATEPVQLGLLAATYFACALPFFFGGLVIGAAFAATAAPGVVYAATMSGSAVGALLPLVALPALGLRGALLVPAAVAALPLLWQARRLWQTRRAGAVRAAAAAGLIVVTAAAAVLTVAHPDFAPRPAPFKYLSQLLRYPGTEVISRRDTSRGRLERVTGPTLRFAPGLSLGTAHRVAPQVAEVLDGDAALFLMQETEHVLASHPAAGLVAVPAPRRVLVLPDGGGTALAIAEQSGAGSQVVAQPHPELARRLRVWGQSRGGRLQVVGEEPRATVRRMVAAGSTVDLLLVEDWGASLPGTQSHSQEPLLTVDAFVDYLAVLAPGGVLSVSRRLLLPPANAPRLVATARAALLATRSAASTAEVRAHIIVLRNWDTFTLVVGRHAFGADQLARMRGFAAQHGFDLVAMPDLVAEERNRFSRLERPVYAEAVAGVLDSVAAAGSAAAVVDLRPATDDRPFFNRMVRWSRLRAYQRATGDRLYGLLLSGDVVALVVLVEAVLLAAALLLLPAAYDRLPAARRVAAAVRAAAAGRAAADSGAPLWQLLTYNLAVGLGFILAELMMVQRLTVVFGDAVVSLAAVLAGLLIWTAIGGLAADRWPLRRAWLAPFLPGVLVAGYAVGGLVAVPMLLQLGQVLRVAAVVGGLGPLGVALGLAFPTGLRLLAPQPRSRAYAWAANGGASVVGAVASTLLAVAAGITALGMVATVAYAAAALVVLRVSASHAGPAHRGPRFRT